MALRISAPIVYGAVAGLLMGGVGVAQIIISARDYEARIAAFDRAFPPGYTGFRDGTGMIRGAQWDFIGAGVEALGVSAIVLVIAAALAVVATRASHSGVVTTLIAAAIGTVAYVVASVIALSAGLHPFVAEYQSELSGIAGCFTISMTVTFVLAWLTGLIGAGLGTLIGRRFTPR